MADVYKDIAVGFHRVNKTPLDGSGLLDGLTQLKYYLEHGTAYDRQILNVIIAHDGGQYCQEFMVREINGKLIPVLQHVPCCPSLIVREYNEHKYIMVYLYYDYGKPFTSKQDLFHFDAMSWSILPYVGIITGKADNEPIDWILEDMDADHPFTQPNFTKVDTYIAAESGNPINGIRQNDSDKFWYPTHDENTGIMPKVKFANTAILWVQADEYCKALGV